MLTMRILALSYLYPNSVYPHYGIFVHNRLKAVSKYHQIVVINPIPWFPGSFKLKRYENYNRIPLKENIDGLTIYHPRFLVIPLIFKFIDAFTYKAAVLPLVKILYQDFPFDNVDLHWTYPDLPTGFAIKSQYKVRMLVTLRGKEAFHLNEGAGREFLIKKYLTKADAVICLSQELQNMAVSFGVEKEKCHVVRNGVDTSRFFFIDKKKCRERLGVDPSEKMILSVGSLNYGKGFDRIIQALPGLLTEQPDCKIYIIGSEGPAGDCRKQLIGMITELGLQGKVYFKGTVKNEELVYWYNAADLFCLSSRSEGSPNVLTEALACGCPSVATQVGSVGEILSRGFLGCCVANTSSGVLEGLQRAIKFQWDRERIFSYMRNFDWNWCSRKVLPIYSDELSGGNSENSISS